MSHTPFQSLTIQTTPTSGMKQILRAYLHSTAENILDVPHTAFAQGSRWRRRAQSHPNHLRRYADRADCEYVGEPRPSGVFESSWAPNGGEVVYFDRFILPSVAQVEYRLDTRHLITTSALSPILRFLKTRMYAVVSVKIRSWIPTANRDSLCP